MKEKDFYRKSRGFNPTLVRLRPRGGAPPPALPQGFQSHAGSIEAKYWISRACGSIRFQSHAGSIEAPSEKTTMNKS